MSWDWCCLGPTKCYNGLVMLLRRSSRPCSPWNPADSLPNSSPGDTSTGTSPTRVSATLGTSFTCPPRSFRRRWNDRPAQRRRAHDRWRHVPRDPDRPRTGKLTDARPAQVSVATRRPMLARGPGIWSSEADLDAAERPQLNRLNLILAFILTILWIGK